MTGVVRFSGVDWDRPPRRPTINRRTERDDGGEGEGSDGEEDGPEDGPSGCCIM